MASISFSMIFDYIAMAWRFAVDVFMSFFTFFLRPYVTLYKFAKVFFQNCINLILITHLSIHATLLYLKMSVRILSGLDKRFNDVAATNSLMYIERVFKVIYKKILDEPLDGTVPAITSSSNVPGTKSITFPAVTESGESSSNTGGSDSSSVDSPQSEPHQGASPSGPSSENTGDSGNSGGNSGGNSSSNGVTNNGTNNGGNIGGSSGSGDAPVTGKAETKSPTKPSTTGSDAVTKAPTGGSSGASSHASSSGSTTASDSSFRTAETDGGVDEVDKSKSAKTAPTATPTSGGATAKPTGGAPAAALTSGGAAATKSPAAPASGGSTT